MAQVPTLPSTAPSPEILGPILAAAAASHHHLCPRQVLGARIGLVGGRALELDLPRDDKRLLTIVETDGCFVSGVEAATGTHVGRRTLRVEDLGRIAATFVDTKTASAVRVHPHPESRDRALAMRPEETRRWFAMRDAYRHLPDAELLVVETVQLKRSLREILSRPHRREVCAQCGEEVINEREVERDGRRLCLACDGRGYYQRV